MKKLNCISVSILLVLLCYAASAQMPDTITATYAGTIYSGYTTSTCSDSGCVYNLQVVLPPGFTITDVKNSFNFRGLGTCDFKRASYIISLDSCKTTCLSCPFAPEVCIIQNLSIYNSLHTCLPPKKCINDTLNFSMNFSRMTGADNGCNSLCVIGDSPWSISVSGTIDSCLTAIIEPDIASILSIYPNPANAQLTLHSLFTHTNDAFTVSIMNVFGEKTSPPTPLHWKEEVAYMDISTLAAGIYFVQVSGRRGTWIGKLIKE